MAREDWADMTPQERGAAFRAHHIHGMPYPNEVTVDDAAIQQLLDTERPS